MTTKKIIPPEAEAETAERTRSREQLEAKILSNPRFRLAKPSGQGFVIVGVKRPPDATE